MEKNSRDRMKWTQMILIFAFMLFIPALIAISIVSFLQTESAFQVMNDSTLSFLGMSIGSYISYFMAIIFQYGQNVALFIRKHFLTDDVVVENSFFQMSEKDLAMGAFIVCAVIDAGTNVIWFAANVDTHADPILNIIIKTVGYAAMIVIIFVEETLGWAIDGFSKAMNQLKSITQYDKKKNSSENNSSNNGTQQNRGQSQHSQTSQNGGNNGNSQQSQQRPPQQTSSVMSGLPKSSVPTNNNSSNPMGYKEPEPVRSSASRSGMDDALRSELMRGIEEMRNKEK